MNKLKLASYLPSTYLASPINWCRMSHLLYNQIGHLARVIICFCSTWLDVPFSYKTIDHFDYRYHLFLFKLIECPAWPEHCWPFWLEVSFFGSNLTTCHTKLKVIGHFDQGDHFFVQLDMFGSHISFKSSWHAKKYTCHSSPHLLVKCMCPLVKKD